MSVITIAVLIFSLAGAADYILGSRFGLGREFEKAFSLFCPMALSMLGMLVIAPAIGAWLTPVFEGFYRVFRVDPSIIPASLFANDMGGMSLSQAVCKSLEMGNFNAFIVSSMMGCVVSFTIPFSLGIVKKALQREFFFGILCGIATVPVGCFAAGLLCGLNWLELLVNLLPLILFAVVIGLALVLAPEGCMKIFRIFGVLMKTLAVIGLGCAVFTFLTGNVIHPAFDTLENAALVCVNACVTMSGAMPLIFLVSRLLQKPLNRLGAPLGIGAVSASAFLGSLVTHASTFGMMDRMEKRGVVLNAAFAVSGAFVFGSHLAFTMAFDSNYILPMIVGKLISGICAVILASLIYKEIPKTAND